MWRRRTSGGHSRRPQTRTQARCLLRTHSDRQILAASAKRHLTRASLLRWMLRLLTHLTINHAPKLSQTAQHLCLSPATSPHICLSALMSQAIKRNDLIEGLPVQCVVPIPTCLYLTSMAPITVRLRSPSTQWRGSRGLAHRCPRLPKPCLWARPYYSLCASHKGNLAHKSG